MLGEFLSVEIQASGSDDAGGGISTTQADTPELPTPINPAVLASMQARRAQEN
jgi:hypothetical protein